MGRAAATLMAAVLVLGIVSGPASAGPHDHHGEGRPCHPTKAERAEAAHFAHVTIENARRYEIVGVAMANGYVPFIDFWRPVGHYWSPTYYRDSYFLDPKRPEALVYANTYTGPKLLGILYSMQDEGRKPPDLGGCLVKWHTHPMCKTATGQRHIWEGNCPPGETYDGESEWMLHVWTVEMEHGPYQQHADRKWSCWPRPPSCS